jgi:hypothetical protein
MLNNDELTIMCNNENIDLVDICMKDELKDIKNGAYIINMQSASENGSGTHWVCALVYDEYIYYYDAFGFPPPQEIINWTKKRPHSHLGWSKEETQSIYSHNCGSFCVGWLMYYTRQRNHIPHNIYKIASKYLKFFKDDTTKNDDVLKRIFKLYSLDKNKPLVRRLINQPPIKYS